MTVVKQILPRLVKLLEKIPKIVPRLVLLGWLYHSSSKPSALHADQGGHRFEMMPRSFRGHQMNARGLNETFGITTAVVRAIPGFPLLRDRYCHRL